MTPETSSEEKVRVCAVVVTFNRKALLPLCLDSLRAQTRPVDQIVIFDNRSTDGTAAMLAERYPDIPVTVLPENSGGAGGFHSGMRWACERGFDWLWVMDDDVTVLPDALETMLRYAPVADMIHSRKRVNGSIQIWEAMWNPDSCIPHTFQRDLSLDGSERDWIPVTYGCFEGALIRRSLVEKTGLPDPRYFVWGDDTVYGFLASLHGSVIYLRYVGLQKEMKIVPGKSRMAYYLGIRNRFLTYETLERAGVTLDRKMFLIHAVYGTFQSWFQILNLSKDRNWTNVEAVWKGLVHGLQGRYGRPYWIT